jgi:putative transcriptional regulator
MTQKSWILAPAKPEYVFTADPRTLWQRVLTDMGGKYAFLATFPEDPRTN